MSLPPEAEQLGDTIARLLLRLARERLTPIERGVVGEACREYQQFMADRINEQVRAEWAELRSDEEMAAWLLTTAREALKLGAVGHEAPKRT